MIIGDGDIAQALRAVDNDRFCFFASGVSNSQETDEAAYRREIDLFRTVGRDRHVVYFSSLAVFFSNTRYIQHKRQMENLVKARTHYTIIRIGNITWGSNPNTLINFWQRQVDRGEKPTILPVERFLVDKDEFLYWVERIPDFSCDMNVTGRRMSAVAVFDEFVRVPCRT